MQTMQTWSTCFLASPSDMLYILISLSCIELVKSNQIVPSPMNTSHIVLMIFFAVISTCVLLATCYIAQLHKMLQNKQEIESANGAE
jgi:hypothetical protein